MGESNAVWHGEAVVWEKSAAPNLGVDYLAD